MKNQMNISTPEACFGKILVINENMCGKCIGYLPKSHEYVLLSGKGGQVTYIKAEKMEA